MKKKNILNVGFCLIGCLSILTLNGMHKADFFLSDMQRLALIIDIPKNEHTEKKIFASVMERRLEELSILLKNGYKDTVIDDKGRNLLILAIEHGRYKEATLLSLHGARHDTVKPIEHTGRDYYVYPAPPLLTLLEKVCESKQWPVSLYEQQKAYRNNDVPVLLEALVSTCPRLSICGPAGDAPLHLLAHLNDSEKRLKIAAQMIGKDYSVLSMRNNLLRTPLFNAVLHADKPYITLLIAHGALVNVRDAKNRNILMVYSSEHPNPDAGMAQWLCNQGVPIDACDSRGKDTLWYAQYYGKSEEYIAALRMLKTAWK